MAQRGFPHTEAGEHNGRLGEGFFFFNKFLKQVSKKLNHLFKAVEAIEVSSVRWAAPRSEKGERKKKIEIVYGYR